MASRTAGTLRQAIRNRRGAPLIRERASAQQDFALFATIAAWMVAVFTADLFTSLGIAVWVFYAGPVLIAFALWRPAAPFAVAVTAALLVTAGFYLSPPGTEPWLSILNRSFGVAVLFVLAGGGWLFIRAKSAIEREEWLQSRLVALTERMAGDQTAPQLTDAVLGFLADDLGAEVGAFFVKDDGVFRRAASFGVPAEAAAPVEVMRGAGLLGQAIKDGRGFLVRDVPADYLIGSSLGQARPRQLLIVPVKVDSEVEGAIELGFFEEIGDVHRHLVDRAVGSIGMALRSAKYRAKQRELLEETQRQGEELHAQNEELETQARALQESQTRLEEQQSELEQMNTALADERAVLERSQAELREKAEELARASRYKSDFLANMSHELRTPLNAALIMARLLAENRTGNLTSEQVKYAETIESSGKDLLNLINDVLDLSKIEAGRLDIRPRKVALSGFLEKIAGAFRPAAEAKGLALSSHLAPEAPVEIETDPQRLEQVLNNFLSNAIKFTDHGEVALTVGPGADGRVRFSVRDSGIGIEPEQQEIIFESFRQASGTAERGMGGTGLGLSIARELARLLGGDIRLESAPGAGSTFTLSLPAAFDPVLHRSAEIREPVTVRADGAPKAKREPPPRPSVIEDDRERLSGDSRLVLVVEDDAAFARILCDLAHEQGFQCIVAGTADEGMALARQFLPSAVILDIGLPDHSGLTVLDRLKRNAATRHIPCMSCLSTTTRRRRCRKARSVIFSSR